MLLVWIHIGVAILLFQVQLLVDNIYDLVGF
jgi:hypothetical protein